MQLWTIPREAIPLPEAMADTAGFEPEVGGLAGGPEGGQYGQRGLEGQVSGEMMVVDIDGKAGPRSCAIQARERGLDGGGLAADDYQSGDVHADVAAYTVHSTGDGGGVGVGVGADYGSISNTAAAVLMVGAEPLLEILQEDAGGIGGETIAAMIEDASAKLSDAPLAP